MDERCICYRLLVRHCALQDLPPVLTLCRIVNRLGMKPHICKNLNC